MTIRIVIVEDQAMVRGALAALLSLERDCEIVGEAADFDSAIETVRRTSPDIVLLDIELPGASGIQTVSALKPQYPAMRFIMLTTFGRPGYLRAALDAGASGFLLKDSPANELASAIRQVMAGGRVVNPELAMAALGIGPNPLTPRQRDVLRLTKLGLSVSGIADRLALSEGTVRNYLSEAISATGGENRLDAMRIAEANGWLE